MLDLSFKSWTLKIFFILEISVFSLAYIFGGRGLQAIRYISHENKKILSNINKLNQDINNLNQELINWSSDDFYKEKLAREQLLMARPNEKIYYLN